MSGEDAAVEEPTPCRTAPRHVKQRDTEHLGASELDPNKLGLRWRLLAVLAIIVIFYGLLFGTVALVETGFGWIVALLGVAGIVLVIWKGWWKP